MESLSPGGLRVPGDSPGLLRGGANVHAVQVHNVYIKSSDLDLVPRLRASVIQPPMKTAQ